MSDNCFGGSMLEIHRFEAEIGGHTVSAGVQPNCGANLVSLVVDGHEYLHYDPAALQADGESYTGCFIMFPTPCRIPDGTYSFEGKTIVQNKAGRLNTIHGLVRDEAFELTTGNGAAELSLEITPDHPVHEGFPFPGLLRVRLALVERGLDYGFWYENRGDSTAPVGFGLHPFWRIPGLRKDVRVSVPCDQSLVMENLIPNGQTEPVAGTALDVREPQSLEGLDLDNVFVNRTPGAPATIEFGGLGTRMTLRADDVFSHQIVYSPPGKPFVCVENLTCAPNAVNLQSAPREATGFRTVEPGESLSGTTRFVVEDL